MSEKVEFSGDVGQTVIGNVNDAPRLSNVVNLNLNEAKKEVQRITDYQRKRINLLVKEWAAICGDKEIEIYKVFIADFGVRYFRELPMEHYLTVKETLEGWIAAGVSKTAAVPPSVAIDHAKFFSREHVHCAACTEKDASFARAQRTIFAQFVLIAILAGSCAWLLYKMPTLRESDQQPSENRCYFDGKAYSLGSTVRNFSGAQQECISDASELRSRWSVERRRR